MNKTEKRKEIIREILEEKYPGQIVKEDAHNLFSILDVTVQLTPNDDAFRTIVNDMVNKTCYNPNDPLFYDRWVIGHSISMWMINYHMDIDKIAERSGVDPIIVKAVTEGSDCMMSDYQKVMNVISMTLLPANKNEAYMEINNNNQAIIEKVERVIKLAGAETNELLN